MINKAHSDHGQALVEFALIAIMFFLFVFGIIESGIILYDKAMVTRGSREGARAGAIFRADPSSFGYSPLTQAEVRTAVNNLLQNRLITFGTPFSAATDVTAMWSTDGGATWNTSPPSGHVGNARIRVDVNFSYRFLVLRNLANLGNNTWPLSTRTIMRME